MADNDPSKHGMRSVPAQVDAAPSSLSGRTPAKERATKSRGKPAERTEEEIELELRKAEAERADAKVKADIEAMWPSS